MEQEYYIYRVTCSSTNKSYIGQTQQYKYKEGNPYHYGVIGRWCDHVSSAKRSNSPLHEAIREHGAGNFVHTILETVSEKDADAREAYWISFMNTLVPVGYNVTSHSRCKHREASDIANIYPNAVSVEMKHIQRGGIPRLVYLYVDTPDGRKRLTFGQSSSDTFESAVADATRILEEYRNRGVAIIDSDKRTPFVGHYLKRIRLVPFNKTMVAVYITDEQNKQTRICFGGKHVTFENASTQAQTFIHGLNSECVENNLLKSRQQVAPCLVEAETK